MKKITKILSLTVVVASMMTPLALLANNSNSVNVKQEVNEVGGDATVELNNVNKTDNGVETSNQAIDANSETDNDKVNVNEIISSNDCTAEDSGQTTTTWMGITNGFINFIVSKDYVSESNVGEVKISSVSDKSITSTYLKIPSYIVFNDNGTNKKYNIVEIGNNVFENCTNLSGQLDLSKATSLTTIGEAAFWTCSGLTGPLTIPASVTSIDWAAFNNCAGLTSLVLTNATSLITIGDKAFENCSGLTGTLTIPASLTTINAYAFLGCDGLSGPLTIPASVTSIGWGAFQTCTSLTSLVLTNATSLTSIGSYAFLFCTGLTALTIPASVTSIGQNAFANCTGLTNLDLSNATSLTSIGDLSFGGCFGLTGTLTIPDSVTEIGNEAFSNAGSQDFKFLSPTPPRSLGINIFGTNVTKTLWVPSAQAKIAYDQYAVDNFGLLDDSYIKFKEIAPTSVDITNLNGSYTINLNETNIPFATARADVQPNDATNKAVTWSLENAPTWLKIDVDGNIFADDNLKNTTPGKFTFKVKAVCQADPTISSTTGDIELNVIQQENTDSFAWWWLLVAEAGALLLIGVISISVIVVKNKKNK